MYVYSFLRKHHSCLLFSFNSLTFKSSSIHLQSEHGPRSESWEGHSDCLFEDSKKRRKCSCDSSFIFQNSEKFLDYVFVLFEGIVGRSKFTSDYSYQLSIVVGLNAFMEKHVFANWSMSLWFTLYSNDSY